MIYFKMLLCWNKTDSAWAVHSAHYWRLELRALSNNFEKEVALHVTHSFADIPAFERDLAKLDKSKQYLLDMKIPQADANLPITVFTGEFTPCTTEQYNHEVLGYAKL